MMIASRFSALVLLTALFGLTGCAADQTSIRTTKGHLQSGPNGPAAVLKVTEPAGDTAVCADFVWGRHDTVGGARRFAEMTARSARQYAQLDVRDMWEAHDALLKAGVEPDLSPESESIVEFARILRCTNYITADIESWGYSYTLFSSAAYLTFRLACHDAVDNSMHWELEVDIRRRGMTDHELAALALREAFVYVRDVRNGMKQAEAAK